MNPLRLTALIRRTGRVAEAAPPISTDEPREPLPAELIGSAQVRHVDAGSCNGCEIEIGAAFGPVYDAERYGARLVASPRHADVVLDHEQALLLGTLGYVARGSGIDTDARRDHSFVDLGEAFDVVVEKGGDVMARYLVRSRELAVSAALVEHLAARLGAPPGERTSVTTHGAGAGLGIVEAWRGALVHRVELDATGALSRVKIVDPSFLNWPALPVSLTDTIVPDFPLANKSFNQSYAGNDL